MGYDYGLHFLLRSQPIDGGGVIFVENRAGRGFVIVVFFFFSKLRGAG